MTADFLSSLLQETREEAAAAAFILLQNSLIFTFWTKTSEDVAQLQLSCQRFISETYIISSALQLLEEQRVKSRAATMTVNCWFLPDGHKVPTRSRP